MDGYHASAAHRIVTIDISFTRTELDKDNLLYGEEIQVTAGLRFVDLGSSNILVKMGNKTTGFDEGITTREAASINKSLATLDRVIGAIVAKQKYVPCVFARFLPTSPLALLPTACSFHVVPL